jgi:hypothetical protein
VSGHRLGSRPGVARDKRGLVAVVERQANGGFGVNQIRVEWKGEP